MANLQKSAPARDIAAEVYGGIRMLVRTKSRDSHELSRIPAIGVALHFSRNRHPEQIKSIAYLTRARANCGRSARDILPRLATNTCRGAPSRKARSYRAVSCAVPIAAKRLRYRLNMVSSRSATRLKPLRSDGGFCRNSRSVFAYLRQLSRSTKRSTAAAQTIEIRSAVGK